ncbi:unnamed protein product [Closterium sp. Naga37s-1]|nr:unnamed protein product [Closterium sp. Naga37s-1]
MKPTIRGMKDEWVLCRLLMPPPWLTVSVGDVVGFLVDPARVSAASAAASPASPAASASPASASASASPAASATPFPVIFRQVAAIPGDEMVSSQPSDEPFRIEKKQFWVLADSPAVPAKEALDSRTLGPVHVRDMVGRALYVVRSALDHEPIHNSDQAMVDDSAIMAMESTRPSGWLIEHRRDTFLSNQQHLLTSSLTGCKAIFHLQSGRSTLLQTSSL